MPGSSFWLLPPPSHPLHSILTDLITSTLPSQFPNLLPSPDGSGTNRGTDSTFFPPHLTLTSGISPVTYGDDPQQWLDSIPFPTSPPMRVRFDPENGGGVQTQDTYFRRCFIKVVLDESVRRLAGVARAMGVNGEEGIGPRTEEWLEWWAGEFGPHVSLIYGDVPIDRETLDRIRAVVEDAGVGLGAQPTGTDDGERNGWDGGVIWLVSTDRPVNEWKPIATRVL